jgi:hypothetical protein
LPPLYQQPMLAAIRGIARCCARTTSGHVKAEPLRRVMNSRRRIAVPDARSS